MLIRHCYVGACAGVREMRKTWAQHGPSGSLQSVGETEGQVDTTIQYGKSSGHALYVWASRGGIPELI